MSIQLIGMHLFFYIKELQVNLLNKNFWLKNGPKMALHGQNSHFFYIDPIWLCLTSSQLIGMCLFFYIKELQVNLFKTLKMAIFQPKMALNAKNSHFFYFDPIWLIGMWYYFYIKELRDDLLNKNPKKGQFPTKKGPENGH